MFLGSPSCGEHLWRPASRMRRSFFHERLVSLRPLLSARRRCVVLAQRLLIWPTSLPEGLTRTGRRPSVPGTLPLVSYWWKKQAVPSPTSPASRSTSMPRTSRYLLLMACCTESCSRPSLNPVHLPWIDIDDNFMGSVELND